jgi:hypothetical protein
MNGCICRMYIAQIENNIKTLVAKLVSGELAANDFIYELLLAYGHRNSTISILKTGHYNIAKEPDEIIFKRHLYFKKIKGEALHSEIDRMKNEKLVTANRTRFVIVTDFQNLLAVDTKTGDSLDIAIIDLPKKFDFFLPWAGMEKEVYQGENPADVDAAEKMAKLFDLIKADNFTEETLGDKTLLHNLNVFLTRLLFCFFAEDTEIFSNNQFTNALQAHTNEDGNDLSEYLDRLFKVLNTGGNERDELPEYLANFRYVNGGLFANDIPSPKFSRKSRRILIECGSELDWSDINPDIFGSMFQAVVHPGQRSDMGMHYTSVTNIMKVIEPLFLNDIYEELDKASNSAVKLQKLQQRLGAIKIFDPACGSGNFLIIAYKELRKLEMELIKRWQQLELQKTGGQISNLFSVIRLCQFYGVELDDFAHEVAILSLWLAEHQMNIEFKMEFGSCPPSLPLKNGGNIFHNNALSIDWQKLIGDIEECYVIGNPPYNGFNNQSPEQKKDLTNVFSSEKAVGKLDYVCCWFKKAADFSVGKNISFSFVATSSICQGEQVCILWPIIFSTGLEISFAHSSFPWANNAKDKAAVMCVIVGIKNASHIAEKVIFSNELRRKAKNINGYLIDGGNIYTTPIARPMSSRPLMSMGSNAIDGTHLIVSKEEYDNVAREDKSAQKYFKKFMGGADFLSGKERYCIWINDDECDEARKNKFISKRLDDCRVYRLSAGRDARKVANKPHRFCYRTYKDMPAIIIPQTTSSKRTYLPIGFIDGNVVVSAKGFAIYQQDLFIFAILSSKLHNVWLATTSGRTSADNYAYSVKLTYNTFPIPSISLLGKQLIIEKALTIIAIRERYSEKTLSQIYDSEKMPTDLLAAHSDLDTTVESFYRREPFMTDDERLQSLFNLYEKYAGDKNA